VPGGGGGTALASSLDREVKTMMRQKTRAAAVAIVALGSVWTSGARADDVQRDLHNPSVSPESSSGVNPGTTRGVNRGMPSPRTIIESGEPQDPHLARTPFGVTSTTTTTAATYDPSATADRAADRDTVRPHRPMLITGGAIFLGTYAASAVAGSIVGTSADEKLAIPLVGPWIALGDRWCALGKCGFYEDVNFLAIVTSGVAQAAGLGIAIASFFVDERRPSREAAKPGVRVVPVSMGRGGAGLGAHGTF
jgi:hypothetical protein